MLFSLLELAGNPLSLGSGVKSGDLFFPYIADKGRPDESTNTNFSTLLHSIEIVEDLIP